MEETPHSASDRGNARFLHGDDLGELVRLLQAHTPLERLSNMEARTVFEFMQQRDWRIVKLEKR